MNTELYIKFGDSETKYKLKAVPFEQKIFRNAEAYGWLLSLNFEIDNINSATFDTMLESNNFNKIVIVDTESKVITTIDGYEKTSSAIIKYNTTPCVELQLTKGV